MICRFYPPATVAATCALVVCTASYAQQNSNQQDQKAAEQEAWERFNSGRPAAAASKPSLPTQARKQPTAAPAEDRSHVVLPAAPAPQRPPQLQVETTTTRHYVPGGCFAGGAFFGRSWGGFGVGPFGFGFNGGGGVVEHTKTRVLQEGPSVPSGNYFHAPTPDPSASGNYYQDSTPLPTAAPIIHQQGNPSDYWGPNNNPLPSSMQGGDQNAK